MGPSGRTASVPQATRLPSGPLVQDVISSVKSSRGAPPESSRREAPPRSARPPALWWDRADRARCRWCARWCWHGRCQPASSPWGADRRTARRVGGLLHRWPTSDRRASRRTGQRDLGSLPRSCAPVGDASSTGQLGRAPLVVPGALAEKREPRRSREGSATLTRDEVVDPVLHGLGRYALAEPALEGRAQLPVVDRIRWQLLPAGLSPAARP